MKKFLFIVLLMLGAAPASAQQPQALIVTTCGTPPISYVAGTYGILTMDTTGKLCDGGGGGGGSVTQGTSPWVDNITQFGSSNVVTGTGVGGAGIPRVTVSSDSFPASQAVTGTFWPYTLGQQLAAASVPVVLTAAQLSTLTPPTTFPLNATPTVANGNGVVSAPSSESAAGLSTNVTSALASSLAVKGSPGNLYAFNVSADSTLSGAAWWLMVFNLTSAPADGAVTPAKCYALPSGTTQYSAAWGISPLALSTGIVLVVSTTGCFTKTASAHAFLSGDYK